MSWHGLTTTAASASELSLASASDSWDMVGPVSCAAMRPRPETALDSLACSAGDAEAGTHGLWVKLRDVEAQLQAAKEDRDRETEWHATKTQRDLWELRAKLLEMQVRLEAQQQAKEEAERAAEVQAAWHARDRAEMEVSRLRSEVVEMEAGFKLSKEGAEKMRWQVTWMACLGLGALIGLLGLGLWMTSEVPPIVAQRPQSGEELEARSKNFHAAWNEEATLKRRHHSKVDRYSGLDREDTLEMAEISEPRSQARWQDAWYNSAAQCKGQETGLEAAMFHDRVMELEAELAVMQQAKEEADQKVQGVQSEIVGLQNTVDGLLEANSRLRKEAEHFGQWKAAQERLEHLLDAMHEAVHEEQKWHAAQAALKSALEAFKHAQLQQEQSLHMARKMQVLGLRLRDRVDEMEKAKVRLAESDAEHLKRWKVAQEELLEPLLDDPERCSRQHQSRQGIDVIKVLFGKRPGTSSYSSSLHHQLDWASVTPSST